MQTQANYLIIANDNFVEEVAPLAEWKRMKGLTTKIVKISDVGTTDTALRNYISNAYHNWKQPLAYVLLVGDVNTIPAHTTGTLGNNTHVSGKKRIRHRRLHPCSRLWRKN